MADQGQNETRSRAMQAVKYLTAGAAGTALLGLSALALALTVVGLTAATPVLILLSPVLVPAAAVALIAGSGFLLSGGFGLVAVSSGAWIYNYMAGNHPVGADKVGNHPVGADKVDQVRRALARRARDAKEKAGDYGRYVKDKTQEVTARQ